VTLPSRVDDFKELFSVCRMVEEPVCTAEYVRFALTSQLVIQLRGHVMSTETVHSLVQLLQAAAHRPLAVNGINCILQFIPRVVLIVVW